MAGKKAEKVIVVRKKKRGKDEHHGGAWKVAYADFITAMMAFFLVMWIIGMDDDVREGVQQYFQDPRPGGLLFQTGSVGDDEGGGGGGMVPLVFPDPAANGDLGEVAERIRRRMEIVGLDSLLASVEIYLTDEGLRIEMMETGDEEVFFDRSSAELRPVLVRVLEVTAQELADVPHAVVVEGHTDALRFREGSVRSNWELSVDRANAARRVLESAGLPENRVVEVRGLAERDPRIEADPYDPRNRRISLLLPFETGETAFRIERPAQVWWDGSDTWDQLPGTGPAAQGARMLP